MLILKDVRSIWMRLNTNKLVYSPKFKVQRKTVSRKGLILAACGFCIATLLVGAAPGAKPSKVSIKTLPNKNYQLIVNGKPFIVKGVCYSPVPIGSNHQYDWWSDPNKPWITDGKLMKEMGVNTIRIYQTGENPEAVRQVIRDLYSLYGIRVVLGHWLGFWEYPCPLYGDKRFQGRIKEEIVEMVKLYKDEPGVLFWTLGNENNYSCLGRVNPWTSEEIEKEKNPQKQNQMRAEIYYSYVNDIAKAVHAVDVNHPVALGNGELIGLETAAKVCTDIDLIACIIYRGKTFGNLFKSLRMTFDKPIVLSEIGADAYDAFLNKEDQNMQAFFLESQWRQIYENVAGRKDGAGNCVGGIIFEWTDEWWKHNDSDPVGWTDHATEAGWSNGQYYFDIKAKDNKNMNEEWFGIVAVSPEIEKGINKRIPRKAYYVIREFWKNPDNSMSKKQKIKPRKK